MQVPLRQTRTSSLQSTTFYLQQRDLPWSSQPASHTIKALPEDTGHLLSVSLGQCCFHLQWLSHMVMLHSLLLQGPRSQSRLCSLGPDGNSCATTRHLHSWQQDIQQPEASVIQVAEGNAKWRSVSGIPHFSTPQRFFKLTADHRNHSLTPPVFRGITFPFG